MDGVLVDFWSGVRKLTPELRQEYDTNPEDAPGIFQLMEPIPGAVDAALRLAEQFDVFILSTAPWDNPPAWIDKVNWIKRYLGKPYEKRLILSHRKDLLKGDYIIDDRSKHGVACFEGEWIQFGSPKFPDWESVMKYLQV